MLLSSLYTGPPLYTSMDVVPRTPPGHHLDDAELLRLQPTTCATMQITSGST